MPYEVFSPLMRCADIHGEHSTLRCVAACFNEILEQRGEEIPRWRTTGKTIHVICKVDREGKLQDFGPREKDLVARLELPTESVMFDKPGITTFHNFAKLLYEAARLIPVTKINLDGMFEYSAKDEHFWSTDAGKGQALAYAQQVAFAVELSLKALLEASGKFVTVPERDWQTHDLAKLYELLDEEAQEHLEQRWRSLQSQERDYETLLKFLIATRNLYMDWRYIPSLTSADLSMDIQVMLNVSHIVLELTESLLRKDFPVSIKTEVVPQTRADSDSTDDDPVPEYVWVKGTVLSVNIPDGFEPHSQVEVIVEPEFYFKGLRASYPENDVVAHFRKADVEQYFQMEGKKVSVVGWVTDTEPFILKNAQPNDLLNREASYTTEERTLRGSVYNLAVREDSYKRFSKITLVLRDSTYFSDVDCLFVTEEERANVSDIQPGCEVTIRGQVALLNGRPVSLVRPTIVDR